MENPLAYVEIRRSPVKDKAQHEMRCRSDAHRVLGESRPIPPLAYARDGLGESGEVRYLRLRGASTDSADPTQAPHDRAPTAVYLAAERRRLERDLHDGVQNELVALIVKLDGGALAVRIADDGRGFDPAHTRYGAGLQNIRERIEAIGGSFKLASQPGRGTVLTFSLPWSARPERA